MSWEIAEAAELAILPDCVAIALTNEEKAVPLGFSDSDEFGVVMMALGPKRILIGRAHDTKHPNLVLYNVNAAACCEKFFIASSQLPILQKCTEIIGLASKLVVHKGVNGALDPYKTDLETAVTLAHQSSHPPAITIHLPPVADALVAPIKAAIDKVIAWAAERVPLDIVTDLHVAVDISATANSLDRGEYSAAPVQLPADNHGYNVYGLKEGKVTAQVIVSSAVVDALFGEPGPQHDLGWYLTVRMLSEAWAVVAFDESFPGIQFRPHSSSFAAIRYEQVVAAWQGYFSTRISAQLAPDMLDVMRSRLIAAIDTAQVGIKAVRIEWRFHQSFDRLLQEALPLIRNVLALAGNFLGFMEALNQNFSEEEALNDVLQNLNLAAWFGAYRQDLSRLWARRGGWRSVDEFLALGGHVERLMWQFGIILSPTDNGMTRVDVMLGIDQLAYEEEMERRAENAVKGIGSENN